MTSNDNSTEETGDSAVKKKDKTGLIILAILAIVVTFVLVQFLSPEEDTSSPDPVAVVSPDPEPVASVDEVAPSAGPVSLRGDHAIADANIVNDEASLAQGGRVARTFAEQPPLIPHPIDAYVVDLKVNQCMGCHDFPEGAQGPAPRLSPTHYLDRDGNQLDQMSASRWSCTQCHVTQLDKEPIVANTFGK
jgi:cytochrome c-type protein NapB